MTNVNARSPDWTEEEIAHLKELASQGWSGGKIASTMPGRTRSAVCRQASKHNIPLWGDMSRRNSGGDRRSPAAKVAPRAIPSPKEKEPEPTPLTEAVNEAGGWLGDPETITDRQCKWPYGDPGDKDFHYCGHDVIRRTSYCEGHTRKKKNPDTYRRRVGDRNKKTGFDWS